MRHFQLQSLARFGLALLASLALFALLETRLESRLVAGGIALLSGLALGWLGLAARVRSLAELRAAFQQLESAEGPPRLVWRGRNEMRSLATEFNEMAERVTLQRGALSEEVAQLRAVLEGMVEGVLVLGPDGRIALANRGLRQLLDCWDELEGKLPLEAFRNLGIDAVLQEARESNQPLAREVNLSRDGSQVAEVHAVPLNGDSPSGVVAVFEDRTELRRLEEMRRDFVANASHELKTPVTAIRGFAEILGKPNLGDEDRRKQLAIIQANADRLTHLVEDLLELSRIESGRSRYQPTDLDLGSLAAQVLEGLQPMFEARDIRAELEGGGAAVAYADPSATEQMLRNLLDNAAKYSDPGGHVKVRVSRDALGTHVAVVDDGIGIKPSDQTRIFERFYRVDETRSRALGGTGLGLAIVKHLAQSSGGDIHVTSEHGEGSTFSLTLPCGPPTADERAPGR